VPYGVDSARFAASASDRAAVRESLGLGDAPFVLSAGRLVRKKGFEYLIDAAANLAPRYPSLKILIAGDGDLRAELTARATERGLRSVTFLGTKTQDEVARMMAAADVIAVPSVHDDAGNVDGLPNFALEAMASATPVVVTTAGGLAQAVADGQTGRVVPERDSNALAAAISGLLDQPDRARALGLAARARVERDFSWARVAARFEAIYDDAVARGRRA
jgi:phosphatidylinositol alpha-1,6-mannosyltransferase